MNTGTGWSCSKDGQHKDMYHGTEMVPNWKGKQAVQRGEDAQNMVRFSKDSIQRERERVAEGGGVSVYDVPVDRLS